MVNELYHKDFLSYNDYNKIHLKLVIKKEKNNYNEEKIQYVFNDAYKLNSDEKISLCQKYTLSRK